MTDAQLECLPALFREIVHADRQLAELRKLPVVDFLSARRLADSRRDLVKQAAARHRPAIRR